MATSTLILARENRVMINNIKKDIGDMKEAMSKMVNHYSKRLPLGITILITILSSLVVGLIVGVLK